jgi:hypothetical protein
VSVIGEQSEVRGDFWQGENPTPQGLRGGRAPGSTSPKTLGRAGACEGGLGAIRSYVFSWAFPHAPALSRAYRWIRDKMLDFRLCE